ncbi:MAG TPA: hypothetical protein VHG29_14020 [Novosphingobium sp.]|nr:hypothetical protein [Novosphingobium sp.]
MEHDWEKYLACMDELKRRTQIVREALGPYWTGQPLSVPDVELACLQLRKMYELVVFAALAAHKPRYRELRKRFEKDWKLPEIVRTIQRINPGFLPVAFEDVDGNITELEDRRFTPEKIIRWHAEFGEILHAFNPYRSVPDYKAIADACGAHIDRFTQTLSRHKVNVIKDEVFYLVTMHSKTDGSIQVATFYRTDGELIKKQRSA